MTLQGRNREYIRFALPVLAENLFATLVSLIYSFITGSISRSALAAANTVNQSVSLISALFTMLVSGSAVLTAHLVGEGDEEGTSQTVEQALMVTPLVAAALSVLLFFCTEPVLSLLMPGAEEAFLAEGRIYFRINLLSLPFLMAANACAGVLRAAGASRPCLLATVISNTAQVLCLVLWGKLGISGIGWAAVVCRVVSCGILVFVVLKNRRGFHVQPRRMLKLNFTVIGRILSLGGYMTADSVAVQLGYVIINSLLVSLGTVEAAVYSNLNAVLTFAGIFQSIASVCTSTLVGQRLGEGDIPGARKLTGQIFIIVQICSCIMCLPAMLFPSFCAGLFGTDPEIIAESANFMWIMLPYCFLAVGVNVCEPAVKAAGEVKYTMFTTVGCIWLVRLTLTYLFCVKFRFGVRGVYAANMTSHTLRLLFDTLKIKSKGWGTRKI